MKARGVAVVAFALVGALACAETARFTTAPGESYCGAVVAASFVRAGIPTNAKMRLELDADALQRAPGRIWTSELTPGETPPTGAQLAAIPQLANDPLSTLSFGEGRVKNAISMTQIGGSDVLVVVSLLQSGDVEVRLIRGTGSAPSQIFGIFRLSKEKGDCGLP